jgi:hypothetical protein
MVMEKIKPLVVIKVLVAAAMTVHRLKHNPKALATYLN